MTRELYLQYRRQLNAAILYEWYKERFDINKHNPFLNQTEFFIYIRLWGDMDDLYRKVTAELDDRFKVLTLMNREGKIINYV